MIAAKTRRYLLSGLGLLSLLVFVLGLWSIEAYHVSGIGFNDPVDSAKLFAAFPGVDPMHAAKLELEAVDWVAFPGMGFLGVFPLVCGKRIPLPLIVGYLIVLLACGGWIGALLTLGLPLSFDMTGEFFAEDLPRFYGSGVLSLGILAWIGCRLIEKRKVRAAVLPRTDAVPVP